MYSRDQFLDKSAKGVLENHKREQEERKAAMVRQQKERDLKQLETQLFYKKSEVERMKRSYDRIRREVVVEESKVKRDESELHNNENALKDVETRLSRVDQDLDSALKDVSQKISKEKAIIAEHERALAELEKQKRDAEADRNLKKRTLSESLSRLMFFKRRESQAVTHEIHTLKAHQAHMQSLEKSLTVFTQEIKVLENKIRSLHTLKL